MSRVAASLLLVIVVACQTPASAPPATPSVPVTDRPATPTTAAGSPSPATETARATATPSPTPRPLVGARIDLHELPLAPAELAGTAIGEGGGVVLVSGTSGAWVSGWREPGFTFARLIPSWNAETPDGTWIKIEVQTRRAGGGETKWWSFGTWASGDGTIRRASVKGQRDGDGDVETDVLLASVPMSAYRMRLTLSRASGSSQTPIVRLVTVVASDPSTLPGGPATFPGGPATLPGGPATSTVTIPSPVGPGAGKELAVPPYSQEIHAGEYPEYDGGGEAWCSPTSTAMILAFWGKSPSSADLEWVDPRYPDPQVDHAARFTYDAVYAGAGNWPFNTAYAARHGLRAFVTQLRSLAEAERFIAAGIPLVASVTIPAGALPGFLLPQGSPGHLLVIRGFAANGDVIANDPAATSNASVRRVYPRAAFEEAWLGGSQGTVYVIHPSTMPLPERVTGATPNW